MKVLLNISKTYYQLEQYGKADEYFARAKEIYVTLDSPLRNWYKKTSFSFFPMSFLEESYTKFPGKEEIVMRDEDKTKNQLIVELAKLSKRTKELEHRIEESERKITEYRLAEKLLMESEERWRSLVENASNFVTIVDRNGTIQFINRTCPHMIVEEIIGTGIYDHILSEYHDTVRETIAHIFESGQIGSYEVRAASPESFIWYESQVGPIKRNGEVVAAAIISTEITERKRAEEEILRAKKLESLGVLAGGIAHDFNNILTAIWGNISLAKMKVNPEEEIYNILTEAEKASIQAKDLIQQLLTFSRGGEPVRKITSIGVLVKDSAGFALRGSNVRCSYSMADDLWPVEVDEGQIGQVINNLIINADQAMPQGGVIDVRLENIALGKEHAFPIKEGKYVKISIKDHGIGISDENLHQIFDPYFTTKQKRSGLGLGTSYSIIKKHNGYITAESESGVGTTFYIYLPASSKEILAIEKLEEKSLIGEGKILVMDDEEIVRNFASIFLKDIGYEVELAKDGAEAIKLYKKAREFGEPFDAVIMDLTIPGGMGGKEAVKKLIEIDPEVKAIVSSGYSNDPIMANYSEYGFCNVIAKPYRIKDVSRILHNLLGLDD